MALAAPGQTHDVLLRLWSGEPLDKICGNIRSQDSLPSPANSLVQDASSEPQKNDDGLSNISHPESPITPTKLEDYNTEEHTELEDTYNQEATYNNGSMQTSVNIKKEPENLIPYVDTSIFDNMASTNDTSHVGNTDCNSTPFVTFMGNHSSMLDSSVQYSENCYFTDVGVINWWEPNSFDTTLSSFAIAPSTESATWSYPESPMLVQSQPHSISSVPSSTPSPILTSPSSTSGPSSSGMLRTESASHATHGAKRQYPVPPLAKKRKTNFDTIVYADNIAVTETKSNNDDVAKKRSKSKSPDQKEPSHDRERHRRASARNWQKQKQQTADLEAAMNIAEVRNRELRREYSTVLSQVLDVKNALMDHAKCDHTAINSWLRFQATNFVMNKGMTDTIREGRTDVSQMS